MYRIDKVGRKMPVRYLTTKRIRSVLENDLVEPWKGLHKRLFKDATKELLSYSKLTDLDKVRIERAVYLYVSQKKKEVEGQSFNLDGMAGRDMFEQIANDFMKVVPGWGEKKLEEDKKKAVEKQERQKVDIDRKLVRIFVEAIDEVIKDKNARNAVLEKVQSKLQVETMLDEATNVSQ